MKLPDILFQHLPDESNVWIHASDRKLSETEANEVNFNIEQFLQTWTSHERNVQGDFLLFENQILVIGAFVPNGELSGCGIDKHLHVLDRLANKFTFNWIGALSVLYRETNGQIAVASRAEFKRIVGENGLPNSTPVFDKSISSLVEARNGIERAAENSWHAEQFPFTSIVEKRVAFDQESTPLH